MCKYFVFGETAEPLNMHFHLRHNTQLLSKGFMPVLLLPPTLVPVFLIISQTLIFSSFKFYFHVVDCQIAYYCFILISLVIGQVGHLFMSLASRVSSVRISYHLIWESFCWVTFLPQNRKSKVKKE